MGENIFAGIKNCKFCKGSLKNLGGEYVFIEKKRYHIEKKGYRQRYEY